MSSNNHGVVAKWNGTRIQAHARQIEFSLTKSDMAEILKQPCAYGTAIHNVGGAHVGVDRKDSSLGYTRENSVPCCFKHNMIKGNWFTFDEMSEIVQTHPLLRGCANQKLRRAKAARKSSKSFCVKSNKR